MTDAQGKLQLTAVAGKCLPLDILATGFLPRRTCATPSITLWPVAGEAETVATKTTAFRRDRLTDQSTYARDYGFMLRANLADRPEVVAA